MEKKKIHELTPITELMVLIKSLSDKELKALVVIVKAMVECYY